MVHPLLKIQRLTPDYAQAYRTLMLGAYALHPDAFTSTVQEREALPLAWWLERLNPDLQATQVVIGALDQSTIAGVVGLNFAKTGSGAQSQVQHIATLVSMFVEPRYRHHGVGQLLVEAAIQTVRAMPGKEVLQLRLSEANHAARALYERCGFQMYGLEPKAVRVVSADGVQYINKVLMYREL